MSSAYLTDDGVYPSPGGMLGNGFATDPDPMRAVLLVQPNANETAAPLDRSRSGASTKTLTAKNGAKLSDAKRRYGTAALLLARASKQHVTVTPTGDFAFGTGPFGLGLNMNANARGSRMTLFSSGTGAGCYQLAWTASGAIEFKIVGGATYTTTQTFAQGVDVHVWVSRSADNVLHLFLEGKEVISQSGVTAALAADAVACIGATDGVNDCFDGYLDGLQAGTDPIYVKDFGAGLNGAAPAPYGSAFYVSPTGNDAWSGLLTDANGGTTDGPFATLAKARDAMRASGTVKTVYLRAGRYDLTGGALALTSADSNTQWLAYPNEKPVLSGAETLTGFVSEGAGLYAKATTVNGLDVVIGDTRQKAAQSGVYSPSDPYKSGWSIAPADGSTTTVKFAAGTVDASVMDAGCRIQVFDRERLADAIVTVGAVDTGTSTLTVEAMQYSARQGSTFRFLNRAAYLRNAGEFGWRASDSKLVLKPASAATFEADGVFVARTGSLVTLTGATGCTFKGLTFAHTLYTGSAVSLSAQANTNVFDTCAFAHVGTAIRLDASNANTVKWSSFKSLGNNGVCFQNGAADNIVERSTFSGVGTVLKESMAVGGNGCLRNIVRYNDIDTCARYGISFKDWNANNAHVGNRAEYNKITNVLLETADGAAIESLGRSNGNTQLVVKNNWIDGCRGLATSTSGGWLDGYKGFGVYLDDMTNGVTVTNNFIRGATWASAYIHGGDNNTVTNNVMVCASEQEAAIRIEHQPADVGNGVPANNTVRQNIVFNTAQVTDYWALLTPGTFTLGPNAVYRAPAYSGSGDLVGDPQFTDPANGNWRVKTGSPVYTGIGFADIAYELIGVSGIAMGSPGTYVPPTDPGTGTDCMATTTASRGTLLFDAPLTANLTPNVGAIETEGSGTISQTTIGGEACTRFFLNHTGALANARSEIVTKSINGFSQGGRCAVVGQAYLYGVRSYLGTDYNALDSAEEVIQQFHDWPDEALGEAWRSPCVDLTVKQINGVNKFMVSIRADAKQITPAAGGDTSPGKYESFKTYVLPGNVSDHVGKWTDWVWYIKWGYTDATGALILWRNGVPVLELPAKAVCFNDSSGPYYKCGVYKWDWASATNTGASSRSHYVSNLRIASASGGYNAVAPTQRVNQPTVTKTDPCAGGGTTPGGGGTTPGGSYPSTKGGFLVSGNQILDGAMKPVRFTGANLSGAEWNDGANSFGLLPGGATARNYKASLDQIKSLGFNLIRLCFADTTITSTRTRHGYAEGPNPEFVGKTPLQILGMYCQYARQIGLYVLLDHHRNNAGTGSGTQVNFLAGDGFTLNDIINNWKTLVTHPDIFGNPAVMGCDIHNEPNGRAFDWANWSGWAVAIANAIHTVNPNVVCFVEGNEISYSQGGEAWGWWGGNLRDFDTKPIAINRMDKLALSSHEYGPYLVGPKSWHNAASFPRNMFGSANWGAQTGIWDFFFGYLWRAKRFPILVGELGAKFDDPVGQAKEFTWIAALHRYMNGELNGDGQLFLGAGEVGMSWTMWAMNPTSGDTGGIWQDDWTTVATNRYNQYKNQLWKGTITPPPQIRVDGSRI